MLVRSQVAPSKTRLVGAAVERRLHTPQELARGGERPAKARREPHLRSKQRASAKCLVEPTVPILDDRREAAETLEKDCSRQLANMRLRRDKERRARSQGEWNQQRTARFESLAGVPPEKDRFKQFSMMPLGLNQTLWEELPLTGV